MAEFTMAELMKRLGYEGAEKDPTVTKAVVALLKRKGYVRVRVNKDGRPVPMWSDETAQKQERRAEILAKLEAEL
jgi:hypothetical protein